MAMSFERMKTSEPALAAEVDVWLEQAREVDTAEDEERPGVGMRRQTG